MAKKALAPSSVTARDSKGLKFLSIVEAAYNKAGLSEEEAQSVNDTAGLADLIGNFIAENRSNNKYKGEEVKSSYGYLSGYKPKGLVEQTNRLRELFTGIGFANQDLLKQIENNEVELPSGAEGWFAIPNWIKNPQIFGSTHSQALQTVLDTISKTCDGKFYNYRKGEIDEKHLRQSARTEKFFTELSEAQGNLDILIVPGQFGIRHRGRSVRRVREVFLGNEFGLGAFAVGIMILTHPERLRHYNDLWIDCAGDEFDDSDSAVRFDHAPYFDFHGGKVKFASSRVGSFRDSCGSASGFVSQ